MAMALAAASSALCGVWSSASVVRTCHIRLSVVGAVVVEVA
jgi:hypothetical protein